MENCGQTWSTFAPGDSYAHEIGYPDSNLSINESISEMNRFASFEDTRSNQKTFCSRTGNYGFSSPYKNVHSRNIIQGISAIGCKLCFKVPYLHVSCAKLEGNKTWASLPSHSQ